MENDESMNSDPSRQQSGLTNRMMVQTQSMQPPQPTPLDPSFDRKAAQLETELRQQNTAIKASFENLKHIEGGQLPGLASTLQNLRTAIERIAVADIPNALKPVEDDTTKVRQKFDKFSTESQNKLQGIKDKLADTSTGIQQLLARYSDLSAATRNSVNDVDADLQRSKETLDNVNARLSAIESGLSQADEIVKGLRAEISSMTKAFTEKVNQFQTENINAFNTTSSELASQLKGESRIRAEAMSQIDKQIATVNHNTNDAAEKLTQYLTSTRNQYNNALQKLMAEAKSGLVSAQAASTSGFTEVQKRIEDFVKDSNSQFSNLESEVTSTISALKTHIESARTSLEVALENVSNGRQNGARDVLRRYDDLKKKLTDALSAQATKIDEASNAALGAISAQCDEAVSQIRREIEEIRAQAERINAIEQRVNALQSSAERARTQLVEQLESLSQRYSRAEKDAETLEKEFENRHDAIESKLMILEDPATQPNYATKKELQGTIQRTQELFESRIEEIEGQIGKIFANISEITLKGSGGKKQAPQEPGTAMLDQLVKNQKSH